MKLIKRILRLLLWLLLGLFIGLIVSYAMDAAYEMLNNRLPKHFPLYNPINEKELYEAFYVRMNFFSLALTVFISVYLSLKYDNDRDEYIISKTDGMFRIREAMGDYISSFALFDALSALICGIAITVPFLFIPERFLNTPGFIASLLQNLHTLHTAIGSIGFMIGFPILVLILHIPSLPLAMRYWRARWLCGTATA